MFAGLLGALKALGSIADALGRFAEWAREFFARRAAEEAGALRERDRARQLAEAEEQAARDAADAAERGLDDAPDEFMRKTL